MIGVIGAGTMGADIAALFANASFEVVLVDKKRRSFKEARERHEGKCLDELEEAFEEKG